VNPGKLAGTPWEESNADSGLIEHSSNALRLFMEHLEMSSVGQLLDIGPVCGENIAFLAQRVNRLYICDLFIRLTRSQGDDSGSGMLAQALDYPPESFDGILMWDFPDHVDDQQLTELQSHFGRLLKSNGMLLVCLAGQGAAAPVVGSFVIRNEFQLHCRPQPHLRLPFHKRQSRRIEALLSPFRLTKSYIYRNGLRELLFRNHTA
jgi:hypothetical protein